VDDTLMRRRAADARVARLATLRSDGRPHVVACCFALDGERVYTAVDDVKSKRTLALRRLDNIRHHPQVSLLVDHYDDEDWSALWWVRMDGHATVVGPGTIEHAAALAVLTAKYPQYLHRPPPGPVITILVTSWTAWP
jgi:PPOX class probable F420-dependent enzyme